MNGNSIRALEFEAIRRALVSLAGSPAGRARLAALQPSTDTASVRLALATTSEAARLLRAPGRQPYHDLPDVAEILPAARVGGAHLEPAELRDVASFIEGAGEIGRRVAGADGAPRLAARAAEMRDAREVSAAIRRAILPSGEVSDDASPRLAELRRALVRLRSQLHSVMESYLRGKDADRLLQEKLVTTRNERYVLLLRADQRGQIPGIIHGTSGSGQSLFVEPLPAVELNNDIVQAADQERTEVVRILTDLTAQVGRRADDLAQAVRLLGELDAAQAAALLAAEMDAVEPEIATDLQLELLDARHPLLMPRLVERLGLPARASGEPVPVTLRVGPGEPALVISGPNTGGKTVALKTIGLLSLMAQCGLHVPAAKGSRLPVFQRVFADIGDDQSIAANLSTFSAHLRATSEMARDLALPALVLLDEVGAGTDPTEGGALGVAIVEHFRAAGAMVVATTHHGLMKAYAQSTPGVGCASFGYDPATYEPSYRLALGVPGRSLALEMAERLGLPLAVVRDARARLDQKQAQAEALLKRLEDDRAALQHEREAFDAERHLLDEALERQRQVEREIESKKRYEVQALVRELRRRGEEAARQAQDAIHQAVKRVEEARQATAVAGASARAEALRAIREAQENVLRQPEVAALVAEPERPEMPVVVGARVRVGGLGLVGELTSLGEHGEAEVAVSGKRLRVPRADLTALGAPARPRSAPRPTPAFAVKSHGSAPAELNLVGLTVDEALPRVDKLLDDAALAERRQIRVIHGFGQGRLRAAVAGLLQDHPHVATFHLADPREGGAGVTVVELKE